MRRVTPDDTWLDSWKYSYPYDLEEVYGQVHSHGYAYAYENRRRRTLAFIEEVVSPGARILDVAAAQGNFSLALAERGYRVTWNDLREELVGYVRLKHERGDLVFAPGNVFELEFEDPFDCIVADRGHRARRASGRLPPQALAPCATRGAPRHDHAERRLLPQYLAALHRQSQLGTVLRKRVVFACEALASRLPRPVQHRLMVHTAARFQRT